MSRTDWAEIYDIARYNGVAVHQLVNELHAANPNINEVELYLAAIEWSRNRTNYPSQETWQRAKERG